MRAESWGMIHTDHRSTTFRYISRGRGSNIPIEKDRRSQVGTYEEKEEARQGEEMRKENEKDETSLQKLPNT